MRKRLIVIAADLAMRTQVAQAVIRAGYRVDLAESASHARRIDLDGIALAVIVPRGLGREAEGLASELEATVGRPPVILAGAGSGRGAGHGDRGSTEFDETKLVAQIAEALASVSPVDKAHQVLCFAEFSLDLTDHCLRHETRGEVMLTRGEFAILRVFAERPRRLLSRDQLMQALTGRDAESFDRRVDMLVARLRRKIEADPRQARLIVTVTGIGYKFAADAFWKETASTLSFQEKKAETAEIVPGILERRLLTALSIELVPHAGGTLPEDPELIRPIIGAYRRRVEVVVKQYGGTLGRCFGRETLAYFGYPSALENAPERAIRVGLDLVNDLCPIEGDSARGFAIRAGIATGLVVAEPQGEIVGETPSEAINLRSAAEPGQILISQTSRRLAGGLFTYHDHGSFRVGGLGESNCISQVIGSSRDENRFKALRSASSPFVGRADQIETLTRRWRYVAGGQGCAVFISGEPGIGKSRLAAALLDQIAIAPHNELFFDCLPHHIESAFYPIIRWLENLAGFRSDEGSSDRIAKMRRLFEPSGATDEDTILVSKLLGLDSGSHNDDNIKNAVKRKQRVHEILISLIRDLSLKKPVIVLFEDVHWADSASLEFLETLVGKLPYLHILLLVTGRLEVRLPWLDEPHVTTVPLSRLNRHEATELVDDLAKEQLPNSIKEYILAHTDGVPLFIEELTKAVIESAPGTFASGSPLMQGPSSRHDVPITLQDSLTARLDRLGWAKQIAQFGAALGREFERSALAALMDIAPERLSEGLESLTNSQLIFPRGTDAFRFKHALVQDAAYSSLLRSERRELHRRIAELLEASFPEVSENTPEIVAHHLTEALLTCQAVPWWRKAGRRCVQASANIEAVAHFQRCLAILAELPQNAARDELELEIRIELAVPLMGTSGYTAPEFQKNIARALDLCEQGGDKAHLCPVLWGLVAHAFSSGNVKDARVHADRFLSSAEHQADRQLRMIGHRLLGMTLFGAGDLKLASQHLEQSLALYNRDVDSALAYVYGADQRVAALAYLGRTYHMLGYPETGMELAELSSAEARRFNHANTTIYAQGGLLELYMMRRELAAMSEKATELAKLAEGHAARNYQLVSIGFEQVIMLYRGCGPTALAEIDRCMRGLRDLNWIYWATRLYLLAAESSSQKGYAVQARIWLEEARVLIENLGQDVCLSDLHHVQAEVLRAEGVEADVISSSLRLAIATAQKQGARWSELRSALSLSRLLAKQRRPLEARQVLEPVLDTFTEGMNLSNLIAAKELLDSLDAQA
jgi:DNA-binding response OmpR family regulator/class 3 adenylate cyclase